MSLNGAFSSNKKLISYFVISLFLFVALIIYSGYLQRSVNQENQFQSIQEKFNENALILDKKAQEILFVLNNSNQKTWPLLERLLYKTDILAQVYQNDSLLFWNNQLISNELLYYNNFSDDTVVEQGTGWFLTSKSIQSNFTIFLLKQIKEKYDVENSYLPSVVNSDFSSNLNIQFTSDLDNARFIINNLSGKPIIGISFTNKNQTSNISLFILFLIYVFLYIFIILFLYEIVTLNITFIKNPLQALLFFSFILILFRLVDFYLGFPTLLKHSFLFLAQHDEIAGLTTPGDQVLNTVILLSVSIYLFNQLFKRQTTSYQIKFGYAFLSTVVLGFISFLINFGIYQTVNSLEYHSLLGIQFNDINGYVAFFVVIAFTISMFLFVIAYQRLVKTTRKNVVSLVSILLLFGIFYLIFIDSGKIVFPVTFLLIVFSVLILGFKSTKNETQIVKFIVLLILFSLSSALLINRAEFDNRNKHQERMAELFRDPDDFELEETFKNSYQKIIGDKNIRKILNDSIINVSDLETYIVSVYFGDFLQKFDIQLTICESDDLLELQPDGLIVGCDEYFNELINISKIIAGKLTLYITERRPDRILYLGKIALPSSSVTNENINLYLQFFFTYVPEGIGYPELLVDNNSIELDLSGYSYAIYYDNQLDYKFGNFAYNTSYSYLEKFPDGKFFDFSDYRHYKVEFEPGHYVVLSRSVSKISEKLVTFSILFLCFVTITFFTLVLILGRKTYEQIGLSIRNRLQILFVSTISVVIALLAIITLFYAESNNKDTIKDQLNEKTYSVIIELEHKLSDFSSLEEADPVALHVMLRKFSLVFFSDINLFNRSGQLIASSRPEIFEKGLLSENINPMAFEELIVKNKLFYTTQESIGTASYYSSYAPLYLDDNLPAGIVNLPYFARQSEVRQSYYLMLFTFINLFVIFGIIGAFIALFVSRVIAKPLLLLQQNIGNLRIDKENEKIEWRGEDEIGQLIAEYNRMVDKLEQSTELLKYSERESAWREVAQQIAHEIKNPLTPMKLNVQYLEKFIKTENEEFDDRIKNISASLITQIDSLDRVAEMFSDFAKINTGKFEKVDLVKLAQSSVLLFKSHSKIKFHLDIDNSDNEYFTLGVEKDLLRVFNNLLQNAVQAVEAKENGLINVSINKRDNFISVRIADNGKGIRQPLKSKIFQPYFTTKSGGTGLGLAIVKNIINEIGGEIDFESRENSGTVFTLKFKPF